MIRAIYQRPAVGFSPRLRPVAGFLWRRWVVRLAGWTAFMVVVVAISR